MTSFLFKSIKKLVPRISETELIALRSGTTCIDRQIFEGKVELPKVNTDLESKINLFDSKTNLLLQTFGNQPVYPNPNYKDIIDFIRKNKFFSLIIDEKYDGHKLSVKELSSLLTKITTKSPCLGVTVMVPNSLALWRIISTLWY